MSTSGGFLVILALVITGVLLVTMPKIGGALVALLAVVLIFQAYKKGYIFGGGGA